MPPTLDIITISYNSGKTVQKTLESIRQQRQDINRYIIIDGGSTDNTLAIISDHQDIIDVLVSEPDDGISDAFNKGISRAVGDFILLLNADDWLVPNSLSGILHAIKHEDQVVCTQMLSFVNSSFSGMHQSFPQDIRKRNSMLHPGMIVKRSVYAQIGGYDTSFRVGMDYEFTCRFVVSGGIFSIINQPLVNFSEGGISGRSAWRICMESYMIRRRYFGVILPLREAVQLFKRFIGNFLKCVGARGFIKSLIGLTGHV